MTQHASTVRPRSQAPLKWTEFTTQEDKVNFVSKLGFDKKVKVKDTIARAAVLKHAGMRRPAEKLAFQKKIEKSYRDLLNALKGR